MQPRFVFSLTSLFAVVSGVALWQEPAPAVVSLAAAAKDFLGTLTDEQRAAATAPLDDASRTQWNFVPRTYPGIALGELSAQQQAAAHGLLRAVLSDRGFAKVEAIRALETVLRELEGRGGADASHRDPARYWLQVFGAPAAKGAFAFRLQGHHVSLHFAVADGRLAAASPAFLGANPHAIPDGPRRGERVLAAEEDLARGLLALLDDAQLRQAVIAAEAPADIILGPGRAADGIGAPRGLPWTAMDDLQQRMLWRLVEEFVAVRKGGFAEEELQRLSAAGRDAIHFAWAGSLHRGRPHYYRVHGPTFVIEYDNTQNDANHVHTVYRDLQRDFGGDLLRKHYDHGHR